MATRPAASLLARADVDAARRDDRERDVGEPARAVPRDERVPAAAAVGDAAPSLVRRPEDLVPVHLQRLLRAAEATAVCGNRDRPNLPDEAPVRPAPHAGADADAVREPHREDAASDGRAGP